MKNSQPKAKSHLQPITELTPEQVKCISAILCILLSHNLTSLPEIAKNFPPSVLRGVLRNCEKFINNYEKLA